MTIEIRVREGDNPAIVVEFPNGNRFLLDAEGNLKQWEIKDKLPQGGRWKHLHGRMGGAW